MMTSTLRRNRSAVERAGRAPTRWTQHSWLRLADALCLGGVGIKARPTRTFLPALGIAISIAAVISVVGISVFSRAQPSVQLNSLGINLLTAAVGQDLFGNSSSLSQDGVGKVRLIGNVQNASSTGLVKNSLAYCTPLIDKNASGGITTLAVDRPLLDVVAGQVDKGAWLNEAISKYPATVLGQTATQRLGVVSPGAKAWIGGNRFTVAGILKSVVLALELNDAALIGQGVTGDLLGHDAKPTTVHMRSQDAVVPMARKLLASPIPPQALNEVKVPRPSDALEAKNAASKAFTGLLPGADSIALLVGGIGVANTMIISVLEHRWEIGLRRSSGVMRGHILVQFMTEALLLVSLSGAPGCIIGIGVTVGMSAASGWPLSLPVIVVVGRLGVTIAIGALTGVYPAVRASRTPPTAAFNTQ